MKIDRQFVEVAQRKILIRFAGRGPALLLLHQSPQTSASLVGWIERLAPHYAVFAPDTPGFGASDPLPRAQPEIPDFAAHLALLLDALNIQKALVCGVHTGAVTAIRLACDFPHRVAAVVADGYARFTADERQTLLDGYLPPFEPAWDGSHLLWLLARLREQHFFFPWNDSSRAARMAYPHPSVARLSADVLDILAAGDGYRAGYRAPFLYDDSTAAARLTVPGYICYRAEDVLLPHLARLPALPPHVSAAKVSGPTALVEAADAAFARHAADASMVDASAAVAQTLSPRARVVASRFGCLAIKCADQANGQDHVLDVLIPDIGTAAKRPYEPLFSVPRAASVWVFDLPGHGASDRWLDADCNCANVAAALMHATAAAREIRIEARGLSAAVAAAWAAMDPRVTHLRLARPAPLDATEQVQYAAHLPNTAPDATGAYLVAAFNWARMRELFWPWSKLDIAHARKVAAPAPANVHADAVEVIASGTNFHALITNAIATDIAALLAPSTAQTQIVTLDDPESLRLAQRLAEPLGLSQTAQTPRGEAVFLRSNRTS